MSKKLPIKRIKNIGHNTTWIRVKVGGKWIHLVSVYMPPFPGKQVNKTIGLFYYVLEEGFFRDSREE